VDLGLSQLKFDASTPLIRGNPDNLFLTFGVAYLSGQYDILDIPRTLPNINYQVSNTFNYK
jgi:hypothetical protein